MDQSNDVKLPKVSVIIAVYNNSQYLPAAIESALAQDYPNLDVFVCDDCSTEKFDMFNQSPNASWIRCIFPERENEIEDGQKHQSREMNGKTLYYFRLKKNSGPSVARNIAIANVMRGGSHLFQILDSDDQMFPNKVSELIKPILLNPERIAVTYADYNIVSENGTVRYESKPTYDYLKFFNGDDHIHSGFLVSGLALKDRYPYFYPEDQRVCEDYFLLRKILRSTQWLAYHVGQPLTLVRSHSNDSTNSVDKQIWQRDYQKTMMNS